MQVKVYADLNKSQILKGKNKKGFSIYCCFMDQYNDLEKDSFTSPDMMRQAQHIPLSL